MEDCTIVPGFAWDGGRFGGFGCVDNTGSEDDNKRKDEKVKEGRKMWRHWR